MSAEKLNDSLDQLEQAVQAVRQAATSFQVATCCGPSGVSRTR